MGDFSEPDPAAVCKWKETASSSRPLDFSFGDKNHRKKKISEHRLNVLAKEKWTRTKIKSPSLPNEEKRYLQGHTSQKEAVLKKRTLIASKVDAIPPNIQRRQTRGFRGILPRGNNSITNSKFKKLLMRFRFETKEAKGEILSLYDSKNSSTDRHLRYHDDAAMQASLKTSSSSSQTYVLKSGSSLMSVCSSDLLPSSRLATRECLRPTCEKVSVTSSLPKKGHLNKSCTKLPKCVHTAQDCPSSNSSTQPNDRWWLRENKHQECNRKQNCGCEKTFEGKKLLPGFFAPAAKSSSNCQNASSFSILKQTDFRSLRQNLFHTCVEKVGIGATAYQHNESQHCSKHHDKKSPNSSLDNGPPGNTFEDAFDVRKCSCNAKETKPFDADYEASSSDAIPESFYLPPISLANGNPCNDSDCKHNLKHSNLPCHGKGEEMVEENKAENLKTLCLPPLSNNKAYERHTRESLTQDADDEISSANQTLGDCDTFKMSRLQTTKSFDDFEFNLRKFANFKRKTRQKTKEKEVPPPDDSDSSGSSAASNSNCQSLRWKRRRKKKLKKTISNPENSTFKCAMVGSKNLPVSIGSDGDDEMEEDDDKRKIF